MGEYNGEEGEHDVPVIFSIKINFFRKRGWPFCASSGAFSALTYGPGVNTIEKVSSQNPPRPWERILPGQSGQALATLGSLCSYLLPSGSHKMLYKRLSVLSNTSLHGLHPLKPRRLCCW